MLLTTFVLIQSLSHLRLFPTPWAAPPQASLSFTVSQSFFKLTSMGSVMPSNLPLLSLVFPRIRIFSNESVLCTRWPKYQNFSFNISPSKEYSGLLSFRMDWFDIHAVQGTLKCLQHHSSKSLILQGSAFFMGQLPHLYMTPRKIIALTIWTFVGSGPLHNMTMN